MLVRKHPVEDKDFLAQFMAMLRKTRTRLVADNRCRPRDLAAIPFERTTLHS